jgi:hypothetical protein
VGIGWTGTGVTGIGAGRSVELKTMPVLSNGDAPSALKYCTVSSNCSISLSCWEGPSSAVSKPGDVPSSGTLSSEVIPGSPGSNAGVSEVVVPS